MCRDREGPCFPKSCAFYSGQEGRPWRTRGETHDLIYVLTDNSSLGSLIFFNSIPYLLEVLIVVQGRMGESDELVHSPNPCAQLSFQKAQNTRAGTSVGPQKFRVFQSSSLNNMGLLHFFRFLLPKGRERRDQLQTSADKRRLACWQVECFLTSLGFQVFFLQLGHILKDIFTFLQHLRSHLFCILFDPISALHSSTLPHYSNFSRGLIIVTCY